MKTKLFFYSLCFAMMSFLMASCSSSTDELAPNKSEETEFVKVPIGFSGEILDIEESPLNRTNTAKDWYAFQVYSANLNDEYPYYDNYAYGFFDNKKDMIINLKKGYKYKFDVQMIVNASETVKQLCLYNAGWTQINNNFVISSSDWVRYMDEGFLFLSTPNGKFERPNVDRFFGIKDNFVPEKGKNITINMKRVAFGAKFIPKKFTEGKLEISIEGAPILFMNSASDTEVEDIISFNGIESAYSSTDEYSESIPVNIIWVKDNNQRIPIASQNVTFKRNKLTTITFEVKEQTENSSFNLQSDETMQKGDTVEIGGDGTNHNVDPQP